MSENSIMVHVGNDAPVSDKLRGALNDLIDAVESSGMADGAEVEGFASPNIKHIQVGTLRPRHIQGPVAKENGCIGYSWTEEGGHECSIHWG